MPQSHLVNGLGFAPEDLSLYPYYTAECLGEITTSGGQTVCEGVVEVSIMGARIYD